MGSAGGFFGSRGGYWAGTLAGAAGSATLPTTTKGDLIAHNGTTDVRVGVGADGEVLTASAAAASGVAWAAAGGAVDFTAVPAGTVGSPSLRFGDATTGMFRPTANVIAWSISGVEKARFDAGGLQMGLDGTAGTPSIRWGTNEGIFHVSGAVHIVTAGSTRMAFTTSTINVFTLMTLWSGATSAYIAIQPTDMYIGPISNIPMRFITNGADTWQVAADGKFQCMNAANQQTGIGAAGAADPLPATPLGYFKFKNVAGTTVAVPYYTAA